MAMASSSPVNRLNAAAPQIPLAGPDSIMVMGIWRALLTVSTPQLDCMM